MMPKYRVFMSVMIEQVAEIVVEAANPDDAANKAITLAPSAEWVAGDYAEKAQVYNVTNAGTGVIEREC